MTEINIDTCIMFMSTSHIRLFFNISRINMHLFNFHDPYHYVSGWGNSTSEILKQELQKYELNNIIRLLLNL